MAGKQRDKMLLGLAGEYHVASELCRLGYFAALTFKNYPDADIYALTDEKQAIAIQVKTVVGRQGNARWFVPSNAADAADFFVLAVAPEGESDTWQTYVLTGQEVDEVLVQTAKAREERTGKSPEGQPNMIWQKRLDSEAWRGRLGWAKLTKAT